MKKEADMECKRCGIPDTVTPLSARYDVDGQFICWLCADCQEEVKEDAEDETA